jgi:hypothetical protein
VTEIEIRHKNMNREDGFCLNTSWKPLICSQKYHMKPPSHDSLIGFSTGPCESACTAVIREPTLLSLASLCCFCSFDPQPHAYNPHTLATSLPCFHISIQTALFRVTTKLLFSYLPLAHRLCVCVREREPMGMDRLASEFPFISI